MHVSEGPRHSADGGSASLRSPGGGSRCPVLGTVSWHSVFHHRGRRPGRARFRERVGPRVFPLRGRGRSGGLRCSVLVATLRGRHAEAGGGEDIDVTRPTDWVTLAKVVAGFALHVACSSTGWVGPWPGLCCSPWWPGHSVSGMLKAAPIGLVLGFSSRPFSSSGLGCHPARRAVRRGGVAQWVTSARCWTASGLRSSRRTSCTPCSGSPSGRPSGCCPASARR